MTHQAAPVAVTLFRRPDYTARVLDALGECYGICDRDVFLSVDWDARYEREIHQVTTLAADFSRRHARALFFTTNHKHGIDVHKEWLIGEILSAGYDRFIFLEDDILLAEDALHYFDWALDHFQDDPRVVSVCGYHKTADLKAEDLDRCYQVPTFVPWGWAMWADRWTGHYGDGTRYRRDIAGWFGDTASPNGHFDYWWLRLCENMNLQTVFPAVARAQNFGKMDGEHTDPRVFDHMDYNAVGAWQIQDLPDRTE